MTFDPDYMSNNPAFDLIRGIPDEVQRNADRYGHETVITDTTRGAPKAAYSIPAKVEQYDDGFDPVEHKPAHVPDKTQVSYQSFDNGVQTIAGTPAQNINVTMPNSFAPVAMQSLAAPAPMAPVTAPVQAQDLSNKPAPMQIAHTPPGVPPAVASVGENRPAPVIPPIMPAPPPPLNTAASLSSSLPPPPMTSMNTNGAQQLTPTSLPPMKAAPPVA